VGFSFNFDTTQMTFVGAGPGSNAPGAVVNVNVSQMGAGQVGLVMDAADSEKFRGGKPGSCGAAVSGFIRSQWPGFGHVWG